VSIALSKRALSKAFPAHSVRLASLVIGVVLICAAGSVAYFTEARVGVYRDWVVHTYEVKGEIQLLSATLNELRSSSLLAMLNKDPQEVDHFNEQLVQFNRCMASLKQMTTDNPEQQGRLAQLTPVAEKQVQLMKVFANESDRFPSESLQLQAALAQLSERKSQITTLLQDLEATEASLLRIRLNRWNVLFDRNLVTLAVLFLASFALLIYNFGLLLSELARRREQEEVNRQNLESYRALSARILELQDIERRRIARDLHDSVGQFLTGMKLNLGQLGRKNASAHIESPALLADTLDLADRAITEVRTLSHLLHPPLLDELGFESAARWYVEGFAKRSGIQVVFEIAEIVERLPKEIELALFRVLQESLTNVHRHARAQNILVDVKCTDSEVILEVRDDGCGIPQEVLQSFRTGLAGGIGLAGMRERLAELNGSLHVQSEKTGTLVRATLPTVLCEASDTPAFSVFHAQA
jgi:signal transduction histidine kinase